MAASVPERNRPVRRRSSYELLPPTMSELRVVLLGNSWSKRSSVGNFILRETVFNTEEEADRCLRVRGQMKDKDMVLINTPDLLHPNLSADRLTELIENCERLSAPGPHVFLLVLQPEDLTKGQKKRLCRVLKLFSDQSFNHSLILISDPTEQSSAATEKPPPVRDLIRLCRHGSLRRKDTEHAELLARLGQIAKETAGGSKGFTMEMLFKAQAETGDDEDQSREPLRMVLIGRNGSGKGSTANTILGKKCFTPRIAPKPPTKSCEKATGEIDGRPVAVVNTPGLFNTSLSDDQIQQELQKCISMLTPGPHVFLLVLQIGSITEEERDSVDMIKKAFGKKSQDFIIIIFTRGEDLNDQSLESYISGCDYFVKQLVSDCGGRYQVFNNKDSNRTQVRELLTMIDSMVKKNGGSCYTNDMFHLSKQELVRKKTLEADKREQEEMKQQIKTMEAQITELKRKNEQHEEQNRLQLEAQVQKLQQEMEAMKRDRNNCHIL